MSNINKRLVDAGRGRSVGLVVLFAACAFLVERYVIHNVQTRSAVITIAILILGIGVALLRVLNVFKSRSQQLTQNIILQVVAVSGIDYMTQFGGPFTIFFIFLSLLFYFDYGRKGVYWSLAIQAYMTVVIGEYLDSWTSWSAIAVGAFSFGSIAVMTLFVTQFLNILADAQKFAEINREDLDLERRRLLSLINNMTDAVLACDANLKIVLSNTSAWSLMGENPIGKYLPYALKLTNTSHEPVDVAGMFDPANEPSAYTDFSTSFQNEENINVYLGINPIRTQSNRTQNGYVVVIRDITKQKSLEDERNEFIAIMSHELRTPVSVVEAGIGMAKFLNEHEAERPKMTDVLERVHGQTLMLSEIVNSLSMFLHSEQHQEKLEKAEVDPRDIVEAVEKDYRSLVEDRGLSFKVIAKPDLPLISTNHQYLYEIIQNFMTNAMKYTRKGGIEFVVYAPNRNQVEFAVHDTGIGISKHDQAHIFEKFWRSEDYRTRESSGTGLGLYITKKLAEGMGTAIVAKSRLNRGSVFSILVDVVHAKPSKRAKHWPSTRKEKLEAKQQVRF